jgi:predicted permease
MIWLHDLFSRIFALFRRRKMDREFDAELAAHLELAIDENLGRGMTAEEARRQAMIRLGGMGATKELYREHRGLPAIEMFLQDVRYSLRTLRRDAGLATFAILIVGLGVGASSTIFSVINALLVRPLPFAEPGRLAWIQNAFSPGLSGETIQVNHLLDLRAQNQSFSEIAAYTPFYKVGDNRLTGSGEPVSLTGVPVTENFFPLLGVKPQLGRIFTAEECSSLTFTAIILSDQLWKSRFASDPNIVGKSITLNDRTVTIVGVMPASFDFSAVFAPGSRIDLFRPFPLNEQTNRFGNMISLIGRLKPGVPVEAAHAEVVAIAQRIERDHPERNAFRPRVTMLREQVSGQLRPALYLLAGAVGLVMLIVCANLSNLLLARTATREKEIAIRAALGADRWRLIRQMLTESLVLSSAGAALGLLLTIGGTRLLANLDTIRIPLLDGVRVDGYALGFTLLTAVLTGIVFGLTPALRVSSISLNSALKDSSRGASVDKRHGRIRGILVMCEVALACVLLIGAGLLIRSFLRVMDVDLGFRPQSAVSLRVDPSRRYNTQLLRNSYFDEVLSRVSVIPGVEAVGLTDSLPLGVNRSWGVSAKGQVYGRNSYPESFVRVVSDGYLRAMGIPLRAGRDFTPADNPSSPRVIIINESLARRLWPGEDPLGKIVRADVERQVIGVLQDVRHLALERESGGEMYLPIRQSNDYSSVTMVVRGSQSPTALTSDTRAALKLIDPNLPTNEFRPLQELVDRSVSPRRFIVLLLAGFAAFALILAALGIYGVISYSVNQRKHEIGIRLALGASALDLQKLILGETLKLAAIGMSVGLAAAWSLGRVLQGLLFGIMPSDPLTFAAALVLLTGVAALAGYLPARRASRLDPVVALRAE